MVDVHLLTTFMSAGFVECIAAVLPPAVNLFGMTDHALWTVASGCAALLYAVTIGRTQWERSKASKQGFGPFAPEVYRLPLVPMKPENRAKLEKVLARQGLLQPQKV